LSPQQSKSKKQSLRKKDIPVESTKADVARGPERLQDDAPAPLESGRSAAAVLDEAMECLQEWQGGNGQPASRVLALYSELRGVIRKTQKCMQDATRASRHRPCDFYSGLVHLIIRTGKHHLLNMVIDDMIHQKVPRSLAFYESAMKQLATQKQFRQALSIYDRLAQDGLETSTITYSCLVRFAAEVGELGRAKELFDKLASITTPSIRAYMTVLSVHNKRQDWSSAAATIHDMKSRGVPVDSLALNVALSTGVAADKVTEVQELLSQAEEMTPFVPDVVSYNTVVKAYSQRGNYVEACKVVERMRKNGVKPNAITFNTVMDAAVRGGRPGEAWRKLEQMKYAGYKPDKFSCSILVKALTKSGLSLQEDAVDRALALLAQNDRNLDMTLKMSLYNNIAEASSKAGLAAALRKVKAQMCSKGVTSAP
jgi:pentatricopeptide repeat protein